MMRTALLVAMLVLSSSALAVDRKPIGEVDTDRMIVETQVVAPARDDHLNLVWWIPLDFWEATFANDPSMTDTQKKDIIDFHFFVLSDRDDAGARLVDPHAGGVLRFGLTSRDGAQLWTAIELPLDALYVPRTCPNGRDAHVSWKFCPWTGQKLPD